MTLSNASSIRESISWYAISRGVHLKFVKNDSTRIRVKCEYGCPFLLLVSKDGSNLGLARKKLVQDHNCYIIFHKP